MTSNVINALLLPQIVLIVYLNSESVLAANKTSVDETYVGINGNKPCILSAFRITVAVRPANQTFRGTTYTDISPETSVARFTICESNGIKHYYRYNDSHSRLGNDSRHQSLLSIGFEVSSERVVEIHFKYMEVICSSPRGCFRAGYVGICNPNAKPEELRENNCLLMETGYHFEYIKPNQSHQCSHNSKMTIKDVVYVNELSILRGSFEVDVQFYRIDVISGEYSGRFNPITYCLKDWLLDTTTLVIVGMVAGLIPLLIIAKCLCNCGKSAKRSISRKKNLRNNEDKKLTKESESHKDSEPLGPSIEL